MFRRIIINLDETSACTAEAIVGINDDDFNDCPREVVDTDKIYQFIVEKVCNCRLYMAVSLESVHYYDRDYMSAKNLECRGVRVSARLGDCNPKDPHDASSAEKHLDCFKKDFTELIESLMTYCGQNYAKIYFRGVDACVTAIEPKPWTP
ncbi:MAG: hypothetical protein MJ154_00375 [Candidatus Saccharibacteria bacterium]|nr:hypothetical protein [Candidatus Saccharibacteria bacterium]